MIQVCSVSPGFRLGSARSVGKCVTGLNTFFQKCITDMQGQTWSWHLNALDLVLSSSTTSC